MCRAPTEIQDRLRVKNNNSKKLKSKIIHEATREKMETGQGRKLFFTEKYHIIHAEEITDLENRHFVSPQHNS